MDYNSVELPAPQRRSIEATANVFEQTSREKENLLRSRGQGMVTETVDAFYSENERTRMLAVIDFYPGYPTAHQWYSHILVYTHRFDEALSEAKKAQELDPLSLIINANLGGMLYFDRQYERAVQQLRNTISLDATSPWGHMFLSRVEDAQDKFDDAAKECEAGNRIARNVPLFRGRLGEAYAMAGRKTDALNMLNALLPFAPKGNAVSSGISQIHFGLSDRDKGFEWLENAYQMREHSPPSLATDPLYDELRSDPRCIAVLGKMGLRK